MHRTLAGQVPAEPRAQAWELEAWTGHRAGFLGHLLSGFGQARPVLASVFPSVK